MMKKVKLNIKNKKLSMRRDYRKQLMLQLKQRKFQKVYLDWRQMVIVRLIGAGWGLFMKILHRTNLTSQSLHETYKN